jgi:hypothetical protein
MTNADSAPNPYGRDGEHQIPTRFVFQGMLDSEGVCEERDMVDGFRDTEIEVIGAIKSTWLLEWTFCVSSPT